MSLLTERDLGARARDLLARAKSAEHSKNYDYAISLMQAAVKEEPLFLDGRRFLRAVEIQKYKSLSSFARQMVGMKVGTAAMKLSTAGKKEPAEQLALAEEVLALDPFQAKANSMVGEAGTKLGHPEFRAFALETLASQEKPDKAVLHALASTYMELKDAVKAEKTYERILSLDPRDGDALSGLKNASAAHASRSGGWEKEGADYRNALKNKSEAVDLEQSAKVVKSDEAIEQQIQVNFAKHQEQPNNPAPCKAIGQLYQQQNNFASAIEWFQMAFELGGKVDSSLEKLVGDLRTRLGEQELAALVAAQAEQTDPEVQAQYAAAIEEKKKEINKVRVDQAEARVRAFPADGQYHFELGEALYHIGEYKRALGELQQGLKQPSVRYQALNLMGKCFMSQGMLDLAVKRFSDAADELPVMDELKKDIVYNLGLAYDATKNSEKALEQWKKIYEVDMAYRDVAPRVESSYQS